MRQLFVEKSSFDIKSATMFEITIKTENPDALQQLLEILSRMNLQFFRKETQSTTQKPEKKLALPEVVLVTPPSASKKLETSVASRLNRPIRKKFDPEEIKRRQGLKRQNEAEILRIIKEMNVEEPIEELLSMLSK